MKQLLLMLTMVFVLTGCNRPASYYTNPNSAGFNQQWIGGICEHCGKMFKLSGNQLANVPKIKCPYCGNFSNTKNAAAKWVPVKNQRDQQVNRQLMLGVMQGAIDGINSHNAHRYPGSTPTTTYQASTCTSDYDCSIGNKCVKAPLKSQGTCMKSVNEYGTQTYGSPDPRSIGVNADYDGDCRFDTECPIGFRCDMKYKACVKR